MAKKSKTSSSSSSSSGALPLCQRSVDLLFVLYYIIFIFTVGFTDLHNFTASVMRVPVTDLEHMDLTWPPKFLTSLYFKWARTVDPLLYENPTWWQVIEWINLLSLLPYAFIALFGFLRGWNWVRNWGIVFSSFTLYSLFLCIGCSLYGATPTPNPPIFVAVYIPYAILPILVIMRLWADKPFSEPMSAVKSAFLHFVGWSTMAVFFSYCLKWFVVYEPGMIPAEVLAEIEPILAQLP